MEFWFGFCAKRPVLRTERKVELGWIPLAVVQTVAVLVVVARVRGVQTLVTVVAVMVAVAAAMILTRKNGFL